MFWLDMVCIYWYYVFGWYGLNVWYVVLVSLGWMVDWILLIG